MHALGFTAETQRAQENAEEFYKNFNDSLRSLCVLGVSAVNTSCSAHTGWPKR